MREFQALVQAIEPRRYRSKLTLNARTESLLELIQSLRLLI